MCLSVEALLATYGHAVQIYTNPLTFLSEASRLSTGLVLLDLRMKEMNGLEVLERLKEEAFQLPVIIITGHGDVDLAVRAMKLGAFDFVQKPFREDLLVEKINAALAARQQSTRTGGTTTRALESLTARERQVAEALAGGLSNKQVADQLGLSVRTVEMHRARAMQRLGCRNFADFLRTIIETQN